MQAGVVMLAKSCLHSATPSVWSRNERRPGLTARRKIVDYSRCKFIRSQSHGSWRGDVAGAAASPAAFLPAQRLTAAISRSQHIDELSSICSIHWDALNHIHVSAALSAAVKLPGARRPGAAAALLDSLAARFSRTLPDATLREVATVLWSLAKLGRPAPGALLSALLAEAQRRREPGRDDLLHAASPRALANILWALATWRTRGPDPVLLRLLLERCCQALPAFQPQDTANVLWALAHLTPARGGSAAAPGLRLPGPLLPGLLSTAAAQAGAMTPQGLANSVWACHRLRTPHATAGGFLAAAAAAFVVQLPAASPTDVALLSSSLAGLRFRCPALLRAVAEHCCRSMAGAGRPSGSIRGPPGSESAAPAAVVWSSQSRQRLLWAFASLEFRHPAAVRALLLLGAPQQRSVPDGTDGTDGAGGVGGDLSWDWEPGGTEDIDQGDDAGEGSSAGGGGGRVVLGASSLIWCLARLGCGREPGPEQRAVLAAAEQLWEARGCAALSHAAVAAWGLEQLGLRQARLLGLACERLLTALERTAAAAGANRGAAAARPASPGGDLSPGELDAAVMVLWCLSRRGPAEEAADPSESAAGRAEGQQQQQQQQQQRHAAADADADAAAETELRLLDAFSRAGPRLLPRLSVRQLPRVCCAYVQLGRSDPGIFGTAAEMLVAARARARAGALGLGPGTGRVADAADEAPTLREGSRGVWEASGEEGWTAGEYLEEGEEEDEEEEGEAGGWQLEVDLDEDEEIGSGSGSEAGSDEGSGGGGNATRSSGTRGGSGAGGGAGGGGSGGLLGRLPRNGLAMTLWALASAGFASPHLMQRAVPHVLRLFPPLQPPPPPSLGATDATAAAAAAGELAAEADPVRASVVGPRIVDGEEEEDSAAVGEDGGPGGEAVAARHAGLDAAGGDVPAAAGSGGGGAAAAGGPRAAVNAGGPPVGAAASRWAALILWAFAASDCYNAVLYDNLLSYVLRKVPRLGPGRVAVVLWACAVAGHYRRDALEALSGALREGMRALPPASFTQANWAIAHLSAGLCLSWRGPASSHLAALAPVLTTHQAAVLLWTLAVQQLVLPPQDRRKFARVVDLLLYRLSRRQERAPEPQPHSRPRAVPAPADLCAAAGSDAADDDDARPGVPMQRDDRGLGVGPDPGARVLVPEHPALEPGVALIAAEALALLLASPHRAVRARVQSHLRTTPTPHLPDHLEGDDDDGDYGDGENEEQSTSPPPSSPSLAAQLAAAWQRTLRRRHPQQAAVAAAARQLGCSPRLLRTHAVFPLAAACAIELPDAAPGPAVLLLADRSDFATNVTGQPLGPLFTAVQLLRERGWLVAVVVAPQFAALRLSSRQVRHLRQLLAAAGVETT